MAEKVSVRCPHCQARVRMPLGLRPGKKPRCPSCKTIIPPASVLPPELLRPESLPYAPSQIPAADTADDRGELRPTPHLPPPVPDELVETRVPLPAEAGPTPTFRPTDDTPDAATAAQTPEQAAAKLAELSRRGKLPKVPGYEILSLLGQGGMGVVYRVRQVGLKRDAALKMILGGQYSDPTSRARFQVEAEAIAQLRHPNVVQVYGFGEHDGLPYLALEYVDGGTLGHKLRKEKTLPQDRAAALLAAIADGVAHAHEKGITHRDLKPINILLTAGGVPKVADFGLARLANSDLTSTGALLGTPSYMAPEQAAGRVREIGPASDVYALGAILFEMLTGAPPFRGDTPFEILHKVLTEDPPSLRGLAPRVPRDLETICLKCLSKDAGRRYPTAGELAADLRRWQAGEPIRARRASKVEVAWKRVKRNKPTAVAAAAVLAAAAVVGVVLLSAPTPPGPAGPSDPVAGAPAPKFDDLVARGTRLLDDGDAAGSLLWYSRADAAASADPTRAAVNKARINAILARLSAPAYRLAHAGPVALVLFAPDGRTLLTAGEDRTAVVWDLATGQPRAKAEHLAAVTAAAFSPDGRRFATVTKDRNVYLYDAATGARLAGPLYHPLEVNVVTFAPDGTRLATGGGSAPYTFAVRTFVPVQKQGTRTVYVTQQVEEKVRDPKTGEERAVRSPRTVPVQETFAFTAYETVTTLQKQLRGAREANYAGPDGGFVRQWDVAGGKEVGPAITASDIVDRLAYDPDGRTLALGLATSTLAVAGPVVPAPPAEMPKPKEPEKAPAKEPADAAAPRHSDGRRYIAAPQAPADPKTSQVPATVVEPVAPAAVPLPGAPEAAPVQFWDVSAPQPKRLGGLPLAGQKTPAPAADAAEKGKGSPPRVTHLSFGPAGVVRAVVDSTFYTVDPRTGQEAHPPAFHQHHVQHARVVSDTTSGELRAVVVRKDRAEVVTLRSMPQAMPAVPAPAAGPATVGPQAMPKADPKPAPKPAPAPAAPVTAPAPAPFVAPPGNLVVVALPTRDADVLDAVPLGDVGGAVATLSADGRVRVFDGYSVPESAADAETITLAAGPVALAADPAGRFLAVATADNRVAVWDTLGLDPAPPDVVVRDPVAFRSVGLSADGRHAFARTSSAGVQAWDLATGKSVIEGGPADGVQAAAMNGGTLAAARPGRIELYSAGRADPVARFAAKEFQYNCCLHVSGDGARVFAHNQYNPAPACLVGGVGGGDPAVWTEPAAVNGVRFSADASRVYLACADGKVRVRDAGTGKPAGPNEVATGLPSVAAVDLSPDGTRLLAVGGKALRVFDAATGQPADRPALDLAADAGTCLAFSPDGSRLLTGGGPAAPFPGAAAPGRSVVQLWEWPSLAPAAAPVALAGPPQSVRFSADGRYVLVRWATTQPEATFTPLVRSRVWEAATLTPVEPAAGATQGCDCDFGPAGLFAVSQGRNATVRRVPLGPSKRSADDLAAVVTALAGRTVDSTGEVVPLTGAALDEAWAKARPLFAAGSAAAERTVRDGFADLMAQTADWDPAAAAPLARQLAAAPDLPADLWPAVGGALAAAGEWRGVAAAFEKAVAAKVEEPTSRVRLGLVRLAAGDPAAARAAVEPLLGSPARPPFADAFLAFAPGADAAELDKVATSVIAAPPADQLTNDLHGTKGRGLAVALLRLRAGKSEAAVALATSWDATPADLYAAAAGLRARGDDDAAKAAAERAAQMLLAPPPGFAARWGWEVRVLARVLRDAPPLPPPAPK